MPIYFERYDTENNVFPVKDKQFINGMRKFVPLAEKADVIDDKCIFYPYDYPKSYPQDLLFVFKRPLVIQKVPIPKEKAEQVIRYWNELPEDKYRYGYLRIYISIQKFQGWDFAFGPTEPDVPSFLAHIDGYRIYKDTALQDQIYEKNFVYRK